MMVRRKNVLMNSDMYATASIAVVGSLAFLLMTIELSSLLPLVGVVVTPLGFILQLYIYKVKSHTEVEISEQGFTAFFRFGQPKMIKWENITSLYIEPANPSKKDLAEAITP